MRIRTALITGLASLAIFGAAILIRHKLQQREMNSRLLRVFFRL